jgi:hypothetical protein
MLPTAARVRQCEKRNRPTPENGPAGCASETMGWWSYCRRAAPSADLFTPALFSTSRVGNEVGSDSSGQLVPSGSPLHPLRCQMESSPVVTCSNHWPTQETGSRAPASEPSAGASRGAAQAGAERHPASRTATITAPQDRCRSIVRFVMPFLLLVVQARRRRPGRPGPRAGAVIGRGARRAPSTRYRGTPIGCAGPRDAVVHHTLRRCGLRAQPRRRGPAPSRTRPVTAMWKTRGRGCGGPNGGRWSAFGGRRR